MAIRPNVTLEYHVEPDKAGKVPCQLCQETWGSRATYFCLEHTGEGMATFAMVAHLHCFSQWAIRFYGQINETEVRAS